MNDDTPTDVESRRHQMFPVLTDAEVDDLPGHEIFAPVNGLQKVLVLKRDPEGAGPFGRHARKIVKL